jgi:hypothetical protein
MNFSEWYGTEIYGSHSPLSGLYFRTFKHRDMHYVFLITTNLTQADAPLVKSKEFIASLFYFRSKRNSSGSPQIKALILDLGAQPHFCWPFILHLLQQVPQTKAPKSFS